MTYQKAFLKISWLFAIGGTDEIAETALNCSTTGPGTFDAEAALADMVDGDAVNLGSAIATVLANSNVLWADYSDLVNIKAAAVGTDGHYLTDPTIFGGVTNSGNDSQVLPQSSLVVSLRSDEITGSANYGRMYLPHTSSLLETGTPRISATRATDLAALFATFISDVDAVVSALAGAPHPLIMSRKASGTNKAIISVAAGRVIDTQRRRRNRLAEDYAFGLV